jgi:putative peptidoglycan lipid II flippase
LNQKKQILKSASVISLVTVISRILGYVRDQRITLLLGTTPTADAFVLAYRIPNLIRRLVGEGAVTASFIPIFANYLNNKPREEVWEFAHRLFWTLAVMLAAVTMLGSVFSAQFMRLFTLFAPGQPAWEQAVYLNRIMFPYIYFIGLSALAMAILNCFRVFGTPAATPVLLNLSIIAASVAAVSRHFSSPAVSLGVGVLVGGALQFLILVPQLVRRGMRFNFGLSTSSRMPSGSVTALYVAERVMELVMGGYAIAVATAILPMMSHQAAAGNMEEMKSTLVFSLRIVSFITIPAAVGLVVLREPIIRVLFEHGEFMAESTGLTTRALFYYAFGLPAFAAIKLIVPAFYSTHDMRIPAHVAAWSLGLNIVLNVLFLRWFFSVFGNGGPAVATVAAAYFNFFTLFAIFRLRFGRLGTLGILASLARSGVCAGIMGTLCWMALQVSRFDAYTHFLPRLAIFAVLLLGATVTYLVLAWTMRSSELLEIYGIAIHGEPEAASMAGLSQES